MKTIHVNLPPGAKSIGALFDSPRIVDLMQDMFQVELKDRTFVHVGWFPDWDPSGDYVVSVFKISPDAPLQKPVITKSLSVVKAAVESAVLLYDKGSLDSSRKVEESPFVWSEQRKPNERRVVVSTASITVTSETQLEAA